MILALGYHMKVKLPQTQSFQNKTTTKQMGAPPVPAISEYR